MVAPCYNEEDVLPLFLERVGTVLNGIGASAEIVLVDDGSVDRTWELIKEAARVDPRVRGLRLSRNHGHQLALTAGLENLSRSANPRHRRRSSRSPRLLAQMIAKWTGADVVYGQRTSHQEVCRGSAVVLYMCVLSSSILSGGHSNSASYRGDFRLISRRILDLLNAMPEQPSFVEWSAGLGSTGASDLRPGWSRQRNLKIHVARKALPVGRRWHHELFGRAVALCNTGGFSTQVYGRSGGRLHSACHVPTRATPSGLGEPHRRCSSDRSPATHGARYHWRISRAPLSPVQATATLSRCG